jgi:hypothetical protein
MGMNEQDREHEPRAVTESSGKGLLQPSNKEIPMIEKTDSDAFLQELASIADEISMEGVPKDDAEDLDDSEPMPFTEEEGAEFAALRKQKVLAFAAIAQCISDKNGMGAIETLSDDNLRKVVKESVSATEEWEMAEVDGRTPAMPATELQQRLAAHQGLIDTMLNIRDEVTERWYHRR